MLMMDNATIRVGSFGELIELVPLLLGFEPEESLVVLPVMHGRHQVAARVDLLDVAGNVDMLMSQLWNKWPDADCYAVVFSEDGPLAKQVLELVDLWLPQGNDRALGWVHDAGWETQDGRCGQRDPNGQFAQGARELGLVARASRKELEDQFVSPETTDASRQLFDEVVLEVETLGFDQLIGTIRQGQVLTEREAFLLAMFTKDSDGRQSALNVLSHDNAQVALELWAEVVRKVPREIADGALGMAGLAGWLCGNGSILNICLTRMAEREDPSLEPMYGMLSAIAYNAIAPYEWDQVKAEL